VSLDHPDGWNTLYVHLNNDSYGTDDGTVVGIRRDLAVGSEVRRGEMIGWVGDSGNAEETISHLHFELRMPSLEAVDARESLLAAVEHPALALLDGEEEATFLSTGGPVDPRPSFAGPYLDDDGSRAESDLAVLTVAGARVWCDPWGIRSCPDDPATGAVAVDWISTLAGPDVDPRKGIAYPSETKDFWAQFDLDVQCGTGKLCEDRPVTFGEVTAMLVTVSSQGTTGVQPERAPVVYSRLINACDPLEGTYDRFVTRGELAEMVLHTFGFRGTAPCDRID
jgi:hypothetical protein